MTPRRSRRPRGGAVALAALLLASLAACAPVAEPSASPSATASPSPSAEPSAPPSPSPSPAPTRPALAELELSTDGLGPLALGQAPDTDPATRMVAFEEDGCVSAEFGIAPGDPGADLWRTDASYASSSPAYGPGTAFGVGVDRETGLVTRIDLYSSDIPTDAGVRLGDSRADVDAAYPDATVSPQSLTDIHVVSGANGLLQIEVARNDPMLGDYWGAQVNTVVYIHAVSPELGVFTVAASGNLVGVCGA